MADPHQLLGVDPKSSETEIRQAYHNLARRWHPDRFQDGPERLWAEKKMIDINLAFEEALEVCASRIPEINGLTPESEQLNDARKLLEIGQLTAARRALMRVATRCAEWNYLFGLVLFRLGESEKAVLYFGIASRQRPENSMYKTAYLSAEALRGIKKRTSPLRKILNRARRTFS